MDENTRSVPLELTASEVMYLKDAIRNGDTVLGYPNLDVALRVTRAVIDKLGLAYLEMILVDSEGKPIQKKPGTTPVCFTEDELRLLENKVVSGAQVGTVNIGVHLMRKIIESKLAVTAHFYGQETVSYNDEAFVAKYKTTNPRRETDANQSDSDADEGGSNYVARH